MSVISHTAKEFLAMREAQITSDEGRNISLIEYDNMNNPSRIQFTNGNVTKYVYSVNGKNKMIWIACIVAPKV